MKTLEEVQPGDILIVTYNQIRSLTQVERVTPTQIITLKGCRWRKKNGREVGNAGSVWIWRQIHVPKNGEVDEIKSDMERADLAYKIGEISWRRQSLETLRAVRAVLGEGSDA